jgi:hypothetical protein
VFDFVYFSLLDAVVPSWILLAIALSFVPHDLMYGPQAALIAKCSPARLRYTAARSLSARFPYRRRPSTADIASTACR